MKFTDYGSSLIDAADRTLPIVLNSAQTISGAIAAIAAWWWSYSTFGMTGLLFGWVLAVPAFGIGAGLGLLMAFLAGYAVILLALLSVAGVVATLVWWAFALR